MTSEMRLLSGLQSGHQEYSDLWRAFVKPYLTRGGRMVITAESWSRHRKQKLRGALHALIRELSENYWLTDPDTGMRYRNTVEVWKRFVREQFNEGRSTENTSDDAYALVLLQFAAFVAVELEYIPQEPEE